MKVQDVNFRCGVKYPDQAMPFEGGCGELGNILEGYRCTDCDASFHRKCGRKHFKQEPLEKELKKMRMWEDDVHALARSRRAAFKLMGIVHKVIDIQVKKELLEAKKK